MSRKQKEMKAPIAEVIGRDETEGPHEHEIESAMQTLMRAHEIKGDSEMMGHVQKHAKKKIKSLKGLKALAGQKALEEQGEEK